MVKASLILLLVAAFTVFIHAQTESVNENAGASSTIKMKYTDKSTVEERTRLWESLQENYNKIMSPNNANVKFGVSLIDVNLDEEKNTMGSNAWLRITWEDSRLKWNKEDHNGIDILRVCPHTVWRPDITLYNSADLSNSGASCWDSNVLIYSNGKVLWVPPCHFESYCKLTLKEHPFADQTCTMKFGSWTYDGLTMDLSLYDDKAEIDVSDFQEVSNWKVLETTAKKTSRTYSCCEEPYIDLSFNVTLKRKPESSSLCSA